MNASDQQRFWELYNRNGREAIERSCRGASRVLTDNTLPAEDLVAWAEDRLIRMLAEGGWPIFHDDPTPETADRRVTASAKLLARWAYLALARKHWRRRNAEGHALSRAESIAAASRTSHFETTEQIDADLETIRRAIDEKTRTRLAAAWLEKGEAHRIALALGATSEEADALVDKAVRGEIRRNTIDQMRSRSRATIRDILAGRITAVLVVAFTMVFLSPGASAFGGEQTGGGRGGGASASVSPAVTGGEQTGGGRGG